MSDKSNAPASQKVESGPAPQLVAAIVGVVVVLLLIVANTERVDVNFVVYKAHEIQLWWFTVIVALLTIVAERLILWAWRRHRRRKNSANP